MMPCLREKRLLSAFFDRELSERAKARISRHLDQCRECSREMNRIEEGSRLARKSGRFEIPPADPAMLDRIMACMKLQSARISRRRTFMQCGAAVIVVILVAVFGRPFINTEKEPGGQTLELGFQPNSPDQDILDAFRQKYVGTFREFEFDGSPDPGWVSFALEHPTELPNGMKLSSVMMFHSGMGDSLGLVYTDGKRKLCLLQQPANRLVSFSGVTTVKEPVCRYQATRCRIGQYDVVTWTTLEKRCVLLSNLNRAEIETAVASMKYLD